MTWDREVDLLVAGAGGAGLTAALVGACEGLRVLVAEKTAQVGGTTATSGGTLWVPLTRQGLAAAPHDTLENVHRYLAGETGARANEPLRDAFLEAGPAAIEYLGAKSEVRFTAKSPYPDYHPDRDGGVAGGRALNPAPFDGRLLKDDFELIRPPMAEFMALGGMMLTREEIKHLIRPWKSLKALSITSRRVVEYLHDRLRRRRGTRLTLGNALIGRLLLSCRRRGVDIEVGTQVVELVREGGVVGAVLAVGDRRVRVRALKGVVLATGGCAASRRWIDAMMNVAISHTLAFAGATGDGLDLALAAGAEVDRDHASPFYWMPASIIRWPNGRVATIPHLRDRSKPGIIAVNRAGERFVNEANSYNDFVTAMLASQGASGSPAFLVCDRSFVKEYGLGAIRPVWQRLKRYESAGYIISAATLNELAERTGVDSDRLARSVAAHNKASENGDDRAFGKGSTIYNIHSGDPDNKPNPCLRPISRPPFYAVAVHPAPMASSVGLRTNGDAQVLDRQGAVITGLYAVGNDMSSVMRGAYPGPGASLGPAIVFAYRAAMHAISGSPATTQ